MIDKLRRKTFPEALETIGAQTVTAIKAGMDWNTVETKANQRSIVKSYQNRKIWWLGAGTVFDGGDWKVKAKARWYNYGWTPYPKGMEHKRDTKGLKGKKLKKFSNLGKGWRLGLRKKGGQKIHIHNFIAKAYSTMLPRVNRIALVIISRNLNVK